MTEDDVQESLTNIAAKKKSLAEDLVRTKLRATGLPEETIDILLRQIHATSEAAAGSDENAAEYVRAKMVDHWVESYTPDPKNDRAAILQSQLDGPEDKRPTMDLLVVASDRRGEKIQLNAIETKAHLQGTLPQRRAMEVCKILEVRYERARIAAQRISETGSFKRANLTHNEELDLRTFGALTSSIRSPKLVAGWMERANRMRENAEHAATNTHFADTLAREGVFDDIVPSAYGWNGRGRIESLAFGPNSQQIYLADIWDQLAKCQYAFTHDPIAKQSVRIISSFVNGRGIRIRSTAPQYPQIQAVLDEFESRTRFTRRMKPFTISASRDGEFFAYIYPLGDGRSEVRQLEAASIWEVITQFDDVTKPISYVQRYMTRQQLFAKADNAPKYISREYMASEVVHLKLNATESEPRGRSDLFSVLAILKYLRDLVVAQIMQEQTKASYVYSAQVDGTAADMKRVAQALPKGVPPPGSSFVTNNKTKVEVLSPSSSTSTGQGSINEFIVNLVAIGMGFSKLYLGADGSRSRAGASAQTEPSEKGMEDRQSDIGEFMHEVICRMLANARVGGLLDGVPEEFQNAFNVEMPEILRGDTTQFITNLHAGRADGYLSAQTASGRYATEMEIDGYNFEEEREKIDAERARGIDLPTDSPTAPAGNDPGIGNLTSPGLSDPASSAGKSDIRKTDRQAMDEAARLLSSAGAIIIRRHA